MSSLKHQLMRHEGSVTDDQGNHIPYQDSEGIWTIGYGHNSQAKHITERTAQIILLDDMLDARNDCFKVFPDFDTFSQGRQDAFVNMVFNLGLTRFSGFKRMISAIKKRDWNKAADEAYNSKWRVQVKGRATEIIEMIRQG